MSLARLAGAFDLDLPGALRYKGFETIAKRGFSMLDENTRSQCRLVTDVMDRGLCVRCGACVGALPLFQLF